MNAAMNMNSPVQPALNALHQLRDEVKKRSGKEGGNLNQKNLALLDVLESTLLQVEPLGNMLKLVNQQTEIAVHSFRQLALVQAALPAGNGGDDGSSDTKGM